MEEPVSAESPVTSPAKESDPPPVEAVPTPQASGSAPGHKKPTSTPAGPRRSSRPHGKRPDYLGNYVYY